MMSTFQSDVVEAVLEDVYGQWGYVGAGRKYLVVLTDKGTLFAVTTGMLRTGVVAGVRGGLAAGGGAAGAAASGAIYETERDANQKKSDQTVGLSLDEIMQSNKDNFYLPYSEVQAATFKKGLGTVKVTIITAKGKFYTQFSSNQSEKAKGILASKLGSKMT
jgi:hypothetical protein